MKNRNNSLISIQNSINSEIKNKSLIVDQNQFFPQELINCLAANGLLGFTIPKHYGGLGKDQVELGILLTEIGGTCSSTRSLLTVQLSLVAETILRWGNQNQRDIWLPPLCSGEIIGGFALTEEDSGSDAMSMAASYTNTDSGFILNGKKKWVTFGAIASLFLVFAKDSKERISAFLIDKNTEGLSIEPIYNMLGLRGAMLANLNFNNCFLPKSSLLGYEGQGFNFIANSALDNGRFSIAAGTLGLAKTCVKESILYSAQRKQFGVPINSHQIIKRKIAKMVTSLNSATLLVQLSAKLRKEKDPMSIFYTMNAKYSVCKIASEIASEAVQIHGANGCSENSILQVFYRDAKIMEIIEGSSEIQEITIADYSITNSENCII